MRATHLGEASAPKARGWGHPFGITYDADGNRTQITYPNSTTTTYAYDTLNRLTNLTATETPVSGPPTTVTSFAYTLDEGGRRTQLTEGDGTERQYAYDGIDRLTGETVTGALSYAKTFTYDPVGNRRTQTRRGRARQRSTTRTTCVMS